jgi:hypothetical protein
MPAAPSATQRATLATCDCTQASHTHGTRDMYGYHRCGCTPCGDANRDYNRRAAKYKPRREMVDAELVRARVAVLQAAGLTVLEIAGLAAINSKVIDYAVHGRKGRKPRTVQASTLRALEAISYRDAATVQRSDGRPVNGDIPRRQVQALHSIGWGTHEIAVRIDATPETVRRLLKGYMTTEVLRRRIETAYQELRTATPPAETCEEKTRVSRARRIARENGWTVDTAEDHRYPAAA